MIGRIAIALMLLAPLPAVAQSETGTRIGGRPAQVPDRGLGTPAQRARIWLEGYAACVVRRDPKRVSRILDAPLDTETSLDPLNAGTFDDCLSGGADADGLRMSNRLFRGALYADRVKHLVHRLTPDMIAPERMTLPATASANGDVAAQISLFRFGECVMRKDPVNALALVLARVTTEGETKAVTALGPTLSGCVDTGSAIKLSRSVIQAAVAEAIYRTYGKTTAPTNGAGR